MSNTRFTMTHIKNDIISSIKELIFIFVIGIIFYLNDYETGKNTLYKNCENHHITQLYLFLHHILTSFFIFGWILISNKFILKIYIISIIIALISQYIYRGECPLTTIVNKNCNLSKRNLLRDFLFVTGIKSIDYIHIYYICTIISAIIAYKKIVN